MCLSCLKKFIISLPALPIICVYPLSLTKLSSLPFLLQCEQFCCFILLHSKKLVLILVLQMELCIMILECCSQERTYLRYYGLLGQRFCMINRVHQENFDKCFVQQYSMIHRLETNKLRNVAKFFAHLLGTDALPWHVLAYIRLTEEDTTSSSRIFIKILFQVS